MKGKIENVIILGLVSVFLGALLSALYDVWPPSFRPMSYFFTVFICLMYLTDS
jgi:hypothetical protein